MQYKRWHCFCGRCGGLRIQEWMLVAQSSIFQISRYNWQKFCVCGSLYKTLCLSSLNVVSHYTYGETESDPGQFHWIQIKISNSFFIKHQLQLCLLSFPQKSGHKFKILCFYWLRNINKNYGGFHILKISLLKPAACP